MAIEKTQISLEIEDTGFDIVSREIAQGIKSLDALGIWVYLHSKPGNWAPHPEEIQAHFGIGRRRYLEAMKVLRGHGLVRLIRYGVGTKMVVSSKFHESHVMRPSQNVTVTKRDHIKNKDFIKNKERAIERTSADAENAPQKKEIKFVRRRDRKPEDQQPITSIKKPAAARPRMRRRPSTKPTLADVQDRVLKKMYDPAVYIEGNEARRFWKFYEDRGWMSGRTKMKDFDGALERWEERRIRELLENQPQRRRRSYAESQSGMPVI